MSKYTTDIPKARDQLREIADEIEEHAKGQANRIRDICDHLMTRRPRGRRAAPTRRVVTPEIKREVLKLLRTTDLPQEEIAARFDIDGGRVSEIYNESRN